VKSKAFGVDPALSIWFLTTPDPLTLATLVLAASAISRFPPITASTLVSLMFLVNPWNPLIPKIGSFPLSDLFRLLIFSIVDLISVAFEPLSISVNNCRISRILVDLFALSRPYNESRRSL